LQARIHRGKGAIDVSKGKIADRRISGSNILVHDADPHRTAASIFLAVLGPAVAGRDRQRPFCDTVSETKM
jgi:hypothetical protein